MAVWAIADLHLSFGVPNKEMDVFGPAWTHHHEKIRHHWLKLIKADDLILIAGDISWATLPGEALADLQWIDALPGTKVIIRGNHDFWWSSLNKLEAIRPPSIHFIQNNVFEWKGIYVGGARLWDTSEYQFSPYVEYQDNPRANKLLKVEDGTENERIFIRELNRLELSLKCFPSQAKTRIVMTHYPPINAHLTPSRASAILEKYKATHCVFGHLHNIRPQTLPFGQYNDVNYYLTSCDYLNFEPLKII